MCMVMIVCHIFDGSIKQTKGDVAVALRSTPVGHSHITTYHPTEPFGEIEKEWPAKNIMRPNEQ